MLNLILEILKSCQDRTFPGFMDPLDPPGPMGTKGFHGFLGFSVPEIGCSRSQLLDDMAEKEYGLNNSLVRAIHRKPFLVYFFLLLANFWMVFVPLWIDNIIFVHIVYVNYLIISESRTSSGKIVLALLIQALVCVFGFMFDFDPLEGEYGRSDGDWL